MVEKRTELEKKQADDGQEFAQKLAKLLEEARKKKNVLEDREILDFFKGEQLDARRWIGSTIFWKPTRWTCSA